MNNETKRTSVSINSDLYHWLMEQCHKNYTSVSSEVNKALAAAKESQQAQ